MTNSIFVAFMVTFVGIKPVYQIFHIIIYEFIAFAENAKRFAIVFLFVSFFFAFTTASLHRLAKVLCWRSANFCCKHV